ncbi:MAG: ECF transporter S component, partial [Oscillospiraceae bacterium]
MNTKKFIRISMLTALAVVLTMVPKIPTPTGGYVHFGDSIIYLASIFLGPWAGAAVGAVGHSLADIIGGYPIFALPTFFIKGLMGYTLGK